MKPDISDDESRGAAKGTLIYRQYDRAKLDAEYNNQAKIGIDRFREFLGRCDDQNRAARSRWKCRLDVPYGQTAAEALDIYRPDAALPAPVEVFFHGGYWRMLDKRDFSYVADGLAPHGRMTIVVNYALVPVVRFDELIEQCRRALSWVRRYIGDYGGDPERISVSGHSAGGHIVAMLLATRWNSYGVEDPSTLIQAASAFSGIFDLEPIRLCFLNDILGLTRETARAHSPLNLRPTVNAPLLVGVGRLEGTEYLRQSADFAAAWAAEGHATRLEVFEHEDHFTMREQLGDPTSAAIVSMIRQRDTLRDTSSRSSWHVG